MSSRSFLLTSTTFSTSVYWSTHSLFLQFRSFSFIFHFNTVFYMHIHTLRRRLNPPSVVPRCPWMRRSMHPRNHECETGFPDNIPGDISIQALVSNYTKPTSRVWSHLVKLCFRLGCSETDSMLAMQDQGTGQKVLPTQSVKEAKEILAPVQALYKKYIHAAIRQAEFPGFFHGRESH